MAESRHHLAQVIAERTMHLRDDKELAREVAAYLLEHHETDDFESLIRDILQYRADHGRVEVNVVSAHELTEQVINDVSAMLRREYPAAKDIVINQTLDPSVVGGIRIDLANEQLDLTTRGKLNKFKRLTGAGQE